MPTRRRRGGGNHQAGLSLVELLVGVAIGLFITAVGATLLASSLRESRRLMLEARLTQDLRATADLVVRDLRRAGYWAAAVDGVWAFGGPAVPANPYAALTPEDGASSAASYRYSRDLTENNAVDNNEQFGLRLHNGTIDVQLGAGNWQGLTDADTLTITQFSITPSVRTVSLAGLCAKPCPVKAGACPPRQLVRSLTVVVVGQLVADPSVKRSLRSEVRVRNDPVLGACAT